MPDFVPRRDSELVTWTGQFSRALAADPDAYGVSSEGAAEVADRQAAFAEAYETAEAPSRRTPIALTLKDAARADLLAAVRQAANRARSWPTATDGQLVALGLPPRRTRGSRIGPPADAPGLNVTPLFNRQAVRVRLYDPASPYRTAKPSGVAAAALYVCAGEPMPGASASWVFAGATTRTTADVAVPPDVPPGGMVWVSAYWLNPRGEPGPAGAAVAARVAGGLAIAA